MWAKKKLKVEGYKFCCNQKIEYNEDKIIVIKDYESTQIRSHKENEDCILSIVITWRQCRKTWNTNTSM